MQAAIRRGWLGAAITALVLAALFVSSEGQARAPGCGWDRFSAEQPPGACWRPFSDVSPFNRPLPPAPRQTPDSALVVSTVTGWGPGLRFVVGTADTPYDWGHPVYFNGPQNPIFRIECTDFGGQCSVDGMRVQIPNRARAAGGSDASLAVIDQRRGWEYDFWRVQSKPRGGRGKLRVGWGGRTRIGTPHAKGLGASGSASGFALSAGIIRPAELRAGEIDHALYMTVDCTNGTTVYPAKKGNPGRSCSEIGRSSRTAPAMGQHFYLALTDAEIEALAVPTWQKTILRAISRYGMYVGDTGGDGWGIKIESGSSQTSFGRPDPWVRLAPRLGVTPYQPDDGPRQYVFDMRAAVDWTNELRIAAPCVNRGRC